MARIPTCSGAALFARKLYVELAYPAVQATSGLADTLPTSEPGTPQISYVLAASDAPTITSNCDFSYSLAPLIWAKGRNTGGASRTLSYRLLKNGASVATGSAGSISNNNYYCLSAGQNWGAVPPVVGDTIALSLWASGAGVSLSDKGMGCAASRFFRNRNPLTLVYLVAITEAAAVFKPSWSGVVYSVDGYYLGVARGTDDGLAVGLDAKNSFSVAIGRPDYGCLRLDRGDVYYAGAAYFIQNSGPSTLNPKRITQLRAVELVVPGNIGTYSL